MHLIRMSNAGENEEKKKLHKASDETEAFRIYSNMGEIRETSDGEQRVFLRARMYPGLKTTRSVGDLLAHQIGVTSEPSFDS